ncbi:AraC family transcriptional regulator [Aureimonas ureilytica]|uniref:AraC family transcriptional regulator n=1 Tax=Aureimonas ureilytica TaxID=401562 RepID=A0A175R380_9HYPH|nr:AraC family transcriptional regulator [Aureimonas ureilytica]KTQ85425.1 AraC family transcriptional regulator [Aureimonas ureilytica]
MNGSIERKSPGITLLPVTQATRATFAGLYLERTLLVFIRTGSKRVECSISGELVGQAGDVMIFPPGSMVTMENRPLVNDSYRADAVSLSHELVGKVFSRHTVPPGPIGVQVLRGTTHQPSAVFDLIKGTLEDQGGLPDAIYRHRLLEPLVWLQQAGVRLTVGSEDHPLAKVRRLIQTDLSHSWRVLEVAAHFGMSEATFRRWLSRSGLGFSSILSNSRLEHGLGLLQTTLDPISQIALECGFKTPSHFSDAFRARFGITPRQIRSAAD